MGVIRDNILERVSLEKEKNALILWVGDTGSGKSDGCNSAGLAFDSGFNPDRVAHMTGGRFMKIINHDTTLKRGSVVVWDDAGKGLKSDEWYKLMNRMIRDVLQTFRVDGLIVFVNCPDASFIDKKVLKLFHYWVESSHIDYERKIQHCKFYNIQINRKTGKVYYHRVKYKGKDGRTKVINFWKIPKCDKKFDLVYRRNKLKANRELKLDVEKKIMLQEEEEKREMLTDEEIQKDIMKSVNLYINEYNKRKYVDPFLIMEEFKIGRPRATKIKAVIEKELKLNKDTKE